jgi:hypothetical protein
MTPDKRARLRLTVHQRWLLEVIERYPEYPLHHPPWPTPSSPIRVVRVLVVGGWLAWVRPGVVRPLRPPYPQLEWPQSEGGLVG